MRATSVAEQRFVAMDLDDPPVDYVELAAGFGVDGTLVKHADDITDAVRSAVERGGPHLVEVPITG
jgi:benzoylformate decarboxylase